jgi:hypothetical protein
MRAQMIAPDRWGASVVQAQHLFSMKWSPQLALFPTDRKVPACVDDLRRAGTAPRDGVAPAAAMNACWLGSQLYE